jgi:hypothetical protein
MSLGKLKILAAVAVTTALVATMAVARTVHNQTAATAHATNDGSQIVGAVHGRIAPAQRHGHFACAAAVEQSCEKLEWWPE